MIIVRRYANLEKHNEITNELLTYINDDDTKKRMTYSERVAIYMSLLDEKTDDAFHIFTHTMKYIESSESRNLTLYDLVEQYREIQHERLEFSDDYETEIFRINDDKYVHIQDDDVTYLNANEYADVCYMSTFDDEFYKFIHDIVKQDVSTLTYEQIDKLVREL